MSALASILRIRPGEGRMVGSVVGLLFVASAGLTIGESGVNAVGAAIASAIDDAIGIPGAITVLPVTPQRLKAIIDGRK